MYTLAIVTVGAKIGLFVLGVGLSILAGKLLAEKARKSVISDDKPTTLSQRGSYIPIVIGRRRVGAIFAWAGDRKSRKENVDGNKGGKGGTLVSGKKQKQKVWLENGWHVICLGPAEKLWRIWQHGEIFFGAESQEPLTPTTHPSGTTIDFGGEGQMTIFWGEKLQPINADLADPSRIGISSRWPNMCYIYWEQKRLGTSPIWPLIEYEIEVRPNNVNLSLSENWVSDERGTIWSGGQTDNIYKNRGFSSTVLASFASPTTVARGVSTIDDEDNVLVVNTVDDEIEKRDGFSNTILATIDVSAIDTAMTGVSGGYQPTGGTQFPRVMRTYCCGLANDSLYELAGFSSSVNSTLDVSSIDLNPGAMTMWTESTGPAADACFISQSTQDAHRLDEFTTTVKTTVDYTGVATPQGLSADGVPKHILLCNNGPDDLLQFSDFTTTINATVSVAATDIAPQDIAHERNAERLAVQVRFDPSQGANAGHITDQLLFNKYPHGIGLSTTDFDLSSLELVGNAVEFSNENQPSNLIFVDGEKLEAGFAALIQDLGMFIAWNVELEKYVFTLIREPTGLLPAVSLDLQVDALPERTVMHDDLAADRIVFSFPDRDRNYRDTTITFNDDGQAELVGVTKARDSRMGTITDFATAQRVAERRAQEEMVAPTRFKIKSARKFRTLVPGEPFTLDGLAQVLRLMGMGLDTESDEVVLDCIVDSYGLQVSTAVQNPGGGQVVEDDPDFLDLAFTFLEMNKYFSNGQVQIFVPRLRANLNVSQAFIHISRNGTSFINIDTNAGIQTGGTLKSAIAADDPTIITTGPEFDILGPDITNVQDLSADNASWKAGRQIAIINDELFFLEKVTIISPTVARLDGLIRSRLATARALHSIGDVVYIMDQSDLEAMQDILIIPNVDIHLKSQPNENTVADLDDITAVLKTIRGDALRGLPVENINSDIGDRTWAAGQDLDIRWSYRSSIEPRTGAGQQGAGEATTKGTIQGTFTVKIRDAAFVLVNTFEGLTTNAFTYTNAQMVADFAGEPTSLNVEVINVDNGLDSDLRIVLMEKN